MPYTQTVHVLYTVHTDCPDREGDTEKDCEEVGGASPGWGRIGRSHHYRGRGPAENPGLCHREKHWQQGTEATEATGVRVCARARTRAGLKTYSLRHYLNPTQSSSFFLFPCVVCEIFLPMHAYRLQSVVG